MKKFKARSSPLLPTNQSKKAKKLVLFVTKYTNQLCSRLEELKKPNRISISKPE